MTMILKFTRFTLHDVKKKLMEELILNVQLELPGGILFFFIDDVRIIHGQDRSYACERSVHRIGFAKKSHLMTSMGNLPKVETELLATKDPKFLFI